MGNKPNIVGLTCARGGSKGLPRKNLRSLQGKPLIAWAVEVALQCPSLDRVIVSTDDPEIASVAKQWGAEVPFLRPPELAQDETPEWLVWQHALRSIEASGSPGADVLVSVPATAPLRSVQDVEACISELLQHPDADLVITVTHPHRNPYFNMVTTSDGWVRLASQPPGPIYRRQDAPPSLRYDHCGLRRASPVRAQFNSPLWRPGQGGCGANRAGYRY